MPIPIPTVYFPTDKSKSAKASSHPGHMRNFVGETLFDHQPLG